MASRELSGVFCVYKPASVVSNHYLGQIKRVLQGLFEVPLALSLSAKRPFKVGFAGTLDPLASGLLTIGLNGGTKHLARMNRFAKTYRVQFVFGVETNTLDATGTTLRSEESWKRLRREDLLNILPCYTGSIMQVPPIYSALRINGMRFYELARLRDAQLQKGMPVAAEALPQPQARLVTIAKIELVDFALPRVTISVTCGSGTYIRSLVRDLGLALGSLATMTGLERTGQGPFVLGSDSWQPVRDLGQELAHMAALVRRVEHDSELYFAHALSEKQ